MSYEGEIKLIDFGLAASRLKVEKTAPNVVMGKMAYMSPEQARGDTIDSRVDIFACGVLLYELLVGERYYEGMTPKAIWEVAGRGGFLPRAWANIDPLLQMILSRALHSDPARRTSTCGAFRDELLGLALAQKPGAERALRELMEHTFADDIARERALMARFASVNLASYQAALDDSRASMTHVASSSPPSPPSPPSPTAPEPAVDSSTSPAATVPDGVAASTARDGTQIVARPVRPLPLVVENSGVDAAAFGQSKRPWVLLAVVTLLVMLGVFVGQKQRAIDAVPTPPAPVVVTAPTPASPVAPVVEPAVVPVVAPVVSPVVEPVAPGAPVSVAVGVKPTPAKPAVPVAAPTAGPPAPQAPPVAPEPPVVVEMPVEPPRAGPVDLAAWQRFKRAHSEEPCVRVLAARAFAMGESRLVLDEARQIRTCAAAVGEAL